MARLRRLIGRLVRRAIPDRYHGRLDRFGPDDQQTIIANRFRSGL